MMASLSGGLATMGPAVPYAIAAKFAYPDRPVIAMAGDGAIAEGNLGHRPEAARERDAAHARLGAHRRRHLDHGARGAARRHRARRPRVHGDFVHVPKGAIHRESNPDDNESRLVVVRAGRGPAVVNVDGPAPGDG